MKTVVITSQKGGSGKTTLTAHLAVAVELAGQGPVVIVDTDPQQTLATWWETREAETPQFAVVRLSELPDKLATLRQLGFSYCFIDTPPALTQQNRQVITLADLVLIPTRPSPNDLWSLGATLDLVKHSGTPFVFVMTQAKGNARITVQALAALSKHGQVFDSIIHDRVDYAVSMTDGRTAMEIRPRGPAAAEAAALWRLTRRSLSGVTTRKKKGKIHA